MHVFPEFQVLQDLRKFLFNITTPGLKPPSYQDLQVFGALWPPPGGGVGLLPSLGPTRSLATGAGDKLRDCDLSCLTSASKLISLERVCSCSVALSGGLQ